LRATKFRTAKDLLREVTARQKKGGNMFVNRTVRFPFELILIISLLLILSSCMATPEIRLMAGGVKMKLTQEAPVNLEGSLSPDGNYFLAGGYKYGGFSLWDISRGLQVKRFEAEAATILGLPLGIPVAFTPDGKHALAGGINLKLWDISSGKEVKIIGDSETSQLSLSSDGRTVLSGIPNSPTILYDVASRRIINERDDSYYSIALSADGKYALGGGSGGYMDYWAASTGKIIKRLKACGKTGMVQGVAFSADAAKALSGDTDGVIKLWDLSSGAELTKIKGHTGFQGVMSVAFSPDGKYILSGGGSDGLLKLWDIKTGQEIRTLNVFSTDLLPSPVTYAAFSHDGKRIISIATDASIRIWDTWSGEEIAMLVGFMDGEWLVITSEGYYNASERGAQYLNVTYNGGEYTVDQFYDVFYRPDIVAAKLKGQDIKGLISITMKDASSSPPPSVEFITAPGDAGQGKVKACYRIKNAGGGIGETRLFHNGKLVASDGYYREATRSAREKIDLAAVTSEKIYNDMRGIAIKGASVSAPVVSAKKADQIEECRIIDIVDGENEINITAFNATNTIQGPLKALRFTSAGTKPEDPHLYILAVGINEYLDRGINLIYAARDAEDFVRKMDAQSATLYNPQNVHTILLRDREATKSAILGAVQDISKKAKPHDGFIFFAAGHGVLLQSQYYMLTHQFSGEMRSSDLISSNEIVEMSKKIKSLSQLYVFDTCHAGGVDYIVSGLYDARMSVLAKKMGLHIYASASDRQAAMDGYRGNGLFTYTLLDGLNNNRNADKNKDGNISVIGLGEYSKKMTMNISKEIGHEQTPLIINFGKDKPLYKLR
jgi:hypothetical protein